MRAIFRFSLFTFGFICSIFLSAGKAYALGFGSSSNSTKNISEKVITDSLVQGLRCNQLGVETIYLAIRSDAFSERRNFPVQNWGFNSGGFSIAGCWALSSTQRVFSYLARYNVPIAESSAERTEQVLNLVRGTVPDVDQSKNSTSQASRIREWPNRNKAVFAMKENALLDSYLGTPGLWVDLLQGFKQNIGGSTMLRNFQNDIQTNQGQRFFRFGNVPMGTGSGPRTQKENVESIQRLMLNLSAKRLTLINLRVDQTTQHVVMAKSFKTNSNGDIVIRVYDSNQWLNDQEVIYKTREQQFYAPGILGDLGGHGPLGAFIVSEEERGDLEQAMLKYYQDECR